MPHCNTKKTICMLLTMALLAGLATPAMGSACDCPCCGVYVTTSSHSNHLPTGSDHDANSIESAASTNSCDHCAFNPSEDFGIKTSPRALISSQVETRSQSIVFNIPAPVPIVHAYASEWIALSFFRSAPIYLQTQSLRH